MVPPGAAHSFANGGHERVVMMTTFISDLYVQYFRDVSTMRGLSRTPDRAAGQPSAPGCVGWFLMPRISSRTKARA